VPFTPLPFTLAIVAFDVMCAVALAAAIRVAGVRDWRIYALSLCSFPFVSSVVLGQPDALFALAAALAWRYRDSPRGAVVVGVVIAAKFLAWPLLIWLLVTRRFRQAAIAACSIPAVLLLSWSLIGFKGLTSYPSLVAADAKAFEAKSHSILAAFLRTGLSEPLAMVLAIIAAVSIGATVARVSRGTDLGWFTAALTVGLLSSPILWQHYLLVLFVPAAVLHRRDPDRITWLLIAALWLSPTETPPALWQSWLIPALASALAIRTAFLTRPLPTTSSQRQVAPLPTLQPSVS